MTENVFVIGHDDLNFAKLKSLESIAGCKIHPVLEFEEVQGEKAYSVETIMRKVEQTLDDFDGSIDAIVSLWDFPVSCLLPILCERHALITPSLESVLKGHHKYWSRVEQRAVIPECTPSFSKVDPFDDNALSRIDIDYPFWLKPVKAFRSQLGFKISNEQDFHDSIPIIREKIPRFGKPLDFFLERVKLPPAVASVDGRWCIAEEIISGRHGALEGYVHAGEIEVYGLIEVVSGENNESSFSRFQYPSRLPEEVQERAREMARTVIRAIGIDHSPFNIEFFYNEERDQVYLLEINPRISLSNSDLFEKVDGLPNQKIMLDTALGREPKPPHRQGEFNCAAKFMLRKYEDARVIRVPSDAELQQIGERIPGTLVEVSVKQDMRLSELGDQDSYSYELADIFIGGESEKELISKHRQCVEMLHFEFSEASR